MTVKKKQETYERLVEISRNNDYTKGNFLDYSYHLNYYKLIGIDLSRQTKTNFSEQINFIGKLEDNDATKFFIAEKQQKLF